MPKPKEINSDDDIVLNDSRPKKNQNKNYQKKMDMYYYLYENIQESRNELYVPIFDVNRFNSQTVKKFVKD